jgi:hypothetical protein
MSEERRGAMRPGDQTIFDRSPATLSTHFHYWGRVEAPPMHSPLYTELSYGVATDPDLLKIAAHTGPSQPAPNNLFAGVQYLLLQGAEHSLRRHYPILSGSERPMEPAFPEFRDFCLKHRAELEVLVAERRTQTNAVRRSAALRPAFAVLAQEEASGLSLIEVGTSAGLNLLWDHYRIEYQMRSGRNQIGGPQESIVRLHADGDGPLPDVAVGVPVVSRVGIDTNPIDLDDKDAICWLHALIFPEHVERYEWLDRALEIARKHRPRVIAADVLDVIEDEIEACSADAIPVVFATLVLYQFPKDALDRFLGALDRAAQKRPFWMLSMEPDGKGSCDLIAVRFSEGERQVRKLAEAHPHGWSITWLVEKSVAELPASEAQQFWEK